MFVRLHLLTEADRDAVSRIDEECGYLPIHSAAGNKSPEYCQFLIDAYPAGAAAEEVVGDGTLPIHQACGYEGRLGTLKFLYELYPAGIHKRDYRGFLPIHGAAHSTRG